MKQHFLFLVVTLFSINTYSQLTTQTEYNYMKKGYKQVEENGLDVKKGYTVEEIGNLRGSDITLFATLLRRSDNSIAGIILKTVASYSGTNYYCLPAANKIDNESYGWAEFNSEFATMTLGQQKIIMQWVSYRMAYEMSKANIKRPALNN